MLTYYVFTSSSLQQPQTLNWLNSRLEYLHFQLLRPICPDMLRLCWHITDETMGRMKNWCCKSHLRNCPSDYMPRLNDATGLIEIILGRLYISSLRKLYSEYWSRTLLALRKTLGLEYLISRNTNFGK